MRAFLLCLLALILIGCNRHKGLQIDDPAPVATLQDIHGKAVVLPGDLHGKVWLARFWALDCELCDKEILFGLESLYQKYKDRNFTPVAVVIGAFDPKDPHWQRFQSLTYPILVDERGLVAKKFGVVGLPSNFVIDGEGVLKEKMIGNAELGEFEKLFTTILK